MKNETHFLTLPDRRIAYQQQSDRPGTKDNPGVIFLGGYGSDMLGTKASFLAERAASENFSFLRFDYSGHGLSSGTFDEGTISAWADDALQVLDRLTQGPQILIGSSFGGWIGLLVARARPERVAGFIGLSAAPDFTEDLIRPVMTSAQFEELERRGKITDPSSSPEQPQSITRGFMEDASHNLVLRSTLAIRGPVYLLQSQKDLDVPWKTALRIAEHVESPDVRVTLVKDGDHRLNREQDLALLMTLLQDARKSINGLGGVVN